MTELVPLSSNLSQEGRRLAEALRTLFLPLKVSVRRYGARRHLDAGTVSRYLNGTRVPSWDFVMNLLHDVAEEHGSPTVMTLDHLRDLHRSALRASDSPRHVIQLLRGELADSDRRAREWSLHENVLRQALQERQHRVADLEIQLRQLVSREREQEQEGLDALTRHQEELHTMQAERDRLRQEIGRLTQELEQARKRGLFYEQRCEQLERQLEYQENQKDDLAGPPIKTGARRGKAWEHPSQPTDMRLTAGSVRVGFGWEPYGPPFGTLDVGVLVLGERGLVLSRRHFIHRGQPRTPNGHIELTSQEAPAGSSTDLEEDRHIIRIDLYALPREAETVLFLLSARSRALGDVARRGYVRLVDPDGNELLRYVVRSYDLSVAETTLVMAKMHRRWWGEPWVFRVKLEGHYKSLDALVQRYGASVRGTRY